MNGIARDAEDGIDEEEMLMADNEEYLDRLEGIEGHQNALLGAGGRGWSVPCRFFAAHWGRRYDTWTSGVDGLGGGEERGSENENRRLVDHRDGDQGWALFHGPGVGGGVGIPPAAQIRGLGPESPTIFADFTDEEDTPRTRGGNDTDDEVEVVTDDDDEDDDGL